MSQEVTQEDMAPEAIEVPYDEDLDESFTGPEHLQMAYYDDYDESEYEAENEDIRRDHTQLGAAPGTGNGNRTPVPGDRDMDPGAMPVMPAASAEFAASSEDDLHQARSPPLE